MKRLFLVLALVLMVAGCGTFGDFSVRATTNKSYDYSITAAQAFTDYTDNQVLTNTTDAQVTAGSWAILTNTGGAGTIDLKLLAFGVDCAGVGTTINIPVTASTTVGDTAFSVNDIASINNILPANSQYRLCMIITPTDNTIPMNLTLRFKITISGTIK